MPNSSHTQYTIQVGDTVALTDAFVDRHRGYPNPMSQAEGKVTAIRQLDHITLADVEWDRPGLPKRITLKNLTTGKATAPAS
jgi:hypothetical protein